MQKLICLLGFVLMASLSMAQQINGYWKGKLVMDPGGCFPVYNIEFQLQINGSSIKGTSYHYSDTSNYVKEIFEGSYDSVTKALRVIEQKVEVFHIPPDCVPCIKTYELLYHTDGREEQLRGSWSGRMQDGKIACPSGTIVLIRIKDPAFKPDLPPALLNRKNELIKEIFVDTGRIKIDFYDNGQVDGDTISVYVNNKVTVFQKRLTTKPVTMFVDVDFKKALQEIIMVGENLGSIPPNTALMMITAGEKRYQLFLTSDEKKNALVRIIYRDPKAAPK